MIWIYRLCENGAKQGRNFFLPIFSSPFATWSLLLFLSSPLLFPTETKNYETQNSVAYESKISRYAFIVDYIFDIINN